MKEKVFKWKFRKQSYENIAFEENRIKLLKVLTNKYRCKDEEIEILKEGEVLPNNQINWQLFNG